MTSPGSDHHRPDSAPHGEPFATANWPTDRSRARPGPLLLVLGCAVCLSLVAWLALSVAPSGGPKSNASSTPPPAQQAERTEPAPPPSAPAPVTRIGRGAAPSAQSGAGALEAGSLSRAFESAAESLGADPAEAQRRFAQALAAAREAWPALASAEVTALAERIVAHVLAAAATGVDVGPPIDAIGAPAMRLGPSASARLSEGDIASCAFSFGALVRLDAEPDLPALARARVDAAMSGANVARPAPGDFSPFWDAAAAALRRAPAYIVSRAGAGGASDAGPEGAWRRWLECVRALARAAPAHRDPLLIAGARELLVASSTGPNDAATRALVQSVLADAQWDSRAPDPPPARRAVLEFFDDRRIASRELAGLTQWLAGGVPAAGLGAECVLRADATEAERTRVRDRVAAAWNVRPPGEADALLRRWQTDARRAVGATPPSDTPIDRLARVAALARLCEAGAALRRGESGAAKSILDDPGGPIERAMLAPVSSATPALAPDPERDGKWALRFLSARKSAIERRRAVAELGASTSPIGPIDAETLVDAAVFGSPSDVRQAALRIAERRATEPPVVNALLEMLPRAPRSEAVAGLVARATGAPLPGFRDRDWPIEARRALVAALLKALSGSTQLGSLDRLAEVAARACDGWARAAPAPDADRDGRDTSGDLVAPEQAPPSGSRDPGLCAERVRAALRNEIVALSASAREKRDALLAGLASAERRHAARRSLADGPAQSFEAAMLGVVDLLALVTQAERPASTDAVVGVLADLTASRRASDDVYAHLDACATAALRLSLLRMGDAGPTPPSQTPGVGGAP